MPRLWLFLLWYSTGVVRALGQSSPFRSAAVAVTHWHMPVSLQEGGQHELTLEHEAHMRTKQDQGLAILAITCSTGEQQEIPES